MSKFLLRANPAGSHELLIYGDIGMDFYAEESNDAKSVAEKLSAIGKDDLDVRISSYGGSLADGVAIFNALDRHEGTVTAHIDGVAYSAASLIPMAADDVRMAANATMMIHAPHTFAGGNALELRRVAEILDSMAGSIVSSYTRKGKVDTDLIKGWVTDGEDHYLTAEQAKEFGFVDEITGALDIAASYTGSRFTPPELSGKTKEEKVMAEDTKTAGGEIEPSKAKDYIADHKSAVMAGMQKGAAGENKRLSDIHMAFDGLVDETDPTGIMFALRTKCMEDLSCTVDKANIEILAAMKEQGADPIVTPMASQQSSTGGAYRTSYSHRPNRATAGEDQADKFIMGATKALEIRSGLERNREVIAAEKGNEFISMSLMELGKHSLRMAGHSVGGSANDVARRIITMSGPGQGTDHFPAILENIANKSVMDGYMAAEETWQTWTQPGTLNDYRAASRVNKSLFDTLDKMEEFESFKHGRFADVKQSITGYLHGKSFSLTLQSIVNDDLSMLGDDARAWGEAANTTIGDAVFVVLTTAGTGGYGQTMDEDSTILFHADHNNYVASGSGAAPSSATISAGRTAMMTQTDPNDRIVASRPRYLMHSTTLTMDVFSLLNSQALITGADGTLPERNAVQSLGLQGVEEYRMDSFVSTAWILAAARRTVEVAFVGGQSTPTVERMPSGEIPGITWQISLPFGVAALDYRTLYFNYGA